MTPDKVSTHQSNAPRRIELTSFPQNVPGKIKPAAWYVETLSMTRIKLLHLHKEKLQKNYSIIFGYITLYPAFYADSLLKKVLTYKLPLAQ
jgi:hypothetical protein